MLRARLLLLLAACFFMASAAWADDVGYIDCSSHPDGSPVYGKARQSQDIVATVACGERFTVLLYGFIFSRIQTSDNKVGYVFSNLISIDRSMAAVPRSTEPRLVATSKVPSNAAAPAISNASERVPVASASKVAAPAPQPAPVQPSSVQAQPAAAQPASVQSASTQAAPMEVTLSASASAPAATSAAAQSAANAPDPSSSAPAQPQPASAQPAPTPATTDITLSASATAPAPETRAPEPSPAAVLPNPPAAPQPEAPSSQPTASQPPSGVPEVAPVRDASVRSSWERPLPPGRKTSLIELYGGYSFARFDNGGGSFSNLNGFMGAFGVNIRSWLQLVGDSSYNFITTNGVKTTIYGNHYGPRFFYRPRNRWSFTPFAEALIGGTRLSTSVSGTGGYSTADNEISYKVGGGLDIHPSRHFELRVIDFDYYRTAFGTNLHQNNYWASAGIVLHFFGGRAE